MNASEPESPGSGKEASEPPPAPIPFTVLPPSQRLSVSFSAHQGPLPPPEQLAAYERLHPGSAAWILDQAEQNAEHIRSMERRGAAAQERDALLKRVLPFAVVVVFLAGWVAIAIWASPIIGAAGAFTTLASVLLAYFKSQR